MPFLSESADINQRQVCYEGESALSGRFVVQDVKSNQQTMRRLVFLNTERIVQSEALLKKTGQTKHSVLRGYSYLWTIPRQILDRRCFYGLFSCDNAFNFVWISQNECTLMQLSHLRRGSCTKVHTFTSK